MPRVPYEPYTTAQPQGGAEKIEVKTPGEAFGENIGQALENLGGTTQKVGGELFDRAYALQNLRNEADSRDAQMDLAEQATLKHMQFQSLEGKARADALPGFIQDLKDLRVQIRGRLTNPMAQRYFDADSMPFIQRNIFSAGSAAGEALKTHVVQTAQASVDIAAKTLVNPLDDVEFGSKVDTVIQAADTISGAHNWSPEQRQDYIMTEVSKLKAARYTQIAHTDPQRALELLDKDPPQVQRDYDLTLDRVRAQNRAVGGANLATSVYGDGTKTFQQMEAEVKTRAPALAHDDPLFEKDALNALRTKVVYDKGAQEKDNRTNEQKVQQTVIQQNVQNVQQLRAIPGMAETIDSLPPQMQNSLPTFIYNWQTKKDKLGQETEYNRVMGMLRGDNQAAKEEALNIDPSTLNISGPQMTQILAERGRLLKDPTGDPRVPRALNWMKTSHASELQALGIYNRDRSNPDEYDHYVGALQSAIDVWTQDKGKPPNYKEITEEIGPSIIKQRSGAHFWSSNRAFFDQDLPEGWGDDLKAEAESRGEAPPTDQELYRAYVRTLFLKLYKDAPSGGPTPPESK